MKNTRWIKVMALLLAVLMLLPMALACKKEEAEEEETSAATTADTGDSLYDENGYLKDSLPDDLDYKKYQFNFLGWDGYAGDFWVEKETGDTIDNATYWRNKKVEERLNVILWTTIIPGGNYSYNDFIEVLSSSVMSGTSEYDAVGSYSWAGGVMATKGLSYDLKSLEYLDFDKPWWSKSFVDMSTFDGKLYFATGELSKGFLYNMQCLVLNKTMLAELKLDDPRQKVLDGTWTLSELYKLTENVGANGDEYANKSVKDRFGFSCYNNTLADGFIAGAGVRMAALNSEGDLALTEDFLGEKTDTLVANLNDHFFNTADWVVEGGGDMNSTEVKENLLQGNTLIGTADLGACSGFAAQETWAFGILPFPMWNTDQGAYYTNLGFQFTFFSVPMGAKDPDMSSAVIECMNSESYRSSAVTIFETVMKGRYAQDELDPQMYDIIKANIYVDANRIFNGLFDWGNSSVARFRRAITNPATSGWMSNIGGVKDYINGELGKIGSSLLDPAQ